MPPPAVRLDGDLAIRQRRVEADLPTVVARERMPQLEARRQQLVQQPLELTLELLVGKVTACDGAQRRRPAPAALADPLEDGEELRVGHEVADDRVLHGDFGVTVTRTLELCRATLLYGGRRDKERKGGRVRR
jgi:hypothetical protein